MATFTYQPAQSSAGDVQTRYLLWPLLPASLLRVLHAMCKLGVWLPWLVPQASLVKTLLPLPVFILLCPTMYTLALHTITLLTGSLLKSPRLPKTKSSPLPSNPTPAPSGHVFWSVTERDVEGWQHPDQQLVTRQVQLLLNRLTGIDSAGKLQGLAFSSIRSLN
jgi:hypothetical protein